VAVDGAPADGAWYWEKSAHQGAAVEAHYRPRHYWPAHATIGMNAPMKDLSAGKGLVYDDSLTLSMSTGAANISTVDGHLERMRVSSDGKKVFTFPVSLGAADHPTFGGTKIVMEKDRVQEMKSSRGEPYYDLKVPWSARLTNSGEFVHSASWNGGNVGIRSTSHGCTNLNVAAAQQYFQFAHTSDVFIYTTTGGPRMPVVGRATATGTCRGRRGRPVGFCDRCRAGDSDEPARTVPAPRNDAPTGVVHLPAGALAGSARRHRAGGRTSRPGRRHDLVRGQPGIGHRRGAQHLGDLARVAVNYITPFVVASLGYLAGCRTRTEADTDNEGQP